MRDLALCLAECWDESSAHGLEQDSDYPGLPQGAYLYFVHSHYATAPAANTLTSTEYICQFSSAVANGNAYGVQFHPEKSGSADLKVFGNFIGML